MLLAVRHDFGRGLSKTFSRSDLICLWSIQNAYEHQPDKHCTPLSAGSSVILLSVQSSVATIYNVYSRVLQIYRLRCRQDTIHSNNNIIIYIVYTQHYFEQFEHILFSTIVLRCYLHRLQS